MIRVASIRGICLRSDTRTQFSERVNCSQSERQWCRLSSQCLPHRLMWQNCNILALSCSSSTNPWKSDLELVFLGPSCLQRFCDPLKTIINPFLMKHARRKFALWIEPWSLLLLPTPNNTLPMTGFWITDQQINSTSSFL